MTRTRAQRNALDTVIGPVDPPSMHVMTYNIRRLMPVLRRSSPDFWPDRRRRIARLLTSEQPTILGTQEVMERQRRDMAEILGDRYASVGVGRDADGGGEGSPIFYDTERVTMTGWRQRALSPTPDRPGSRGWGNLVPRIAVAAEFTERTTGRQFVVINTHFDHLSRRSRIRSAEMIARLATDHQGPAIVMGDFNAAPSRPPHRMLAAAGLNDTMLVSARRTNHGRGTYNGFGNARDDRRRIDWIFISDGFTVQEAAINVRRFEGRAASDHDPVHAVVDFA